VGSGPGYQTGNDLRDSIDAYSFMRSNSYPDFCIESLRLSDFLEKMADFGFRVAILG